MNQAKWWAWLLLAAVALLSGCAGFWVSPTGSSSTGGCTSNCSTATSGNFFILNKPASGAPQVVGEVISSGKLNTISGATWNLSSTPSAIAINPAGTLLFVSTTGGIVVSTIGSNGALTPSSSVVFGDALAQSIQVDSTGTWLLDASATGVLFAIPILPTGAVDTSRLINSQPPQLALAALTVQQMAISPDNNLIAVGLGSTGTQIFSFNASSGTLSSVVVKGPKGASAVSVAFAPQTSILFIGETSVFSSSTDSGGIRFIPISSDVLGTEPTASPIASGGTGPHAILPLTGTVYVANWANTSAGNITGFQFTTGTSPTLTAFSTTATTGVNPVGLVEDSSGVFVLAVSNGGSPSFSSFTFDSTTAGQLDIQVVDSSISSPIAIVAAP